ncbi:MAG: hypothetical protein QXU20_03780 [Candidatus Woesearchaeota archaeon]
MENYLEKSKQFLLKKIEETQEKIKKLSNNKTPLLERQLQYQIFYLELYFEKLKDIEIKLKNQKHKVIKVGDTISFRNKKNFLECGHGTVKKIQKGTLIVDCNKYTAKINTEDFLIWIRKK